MGSEMGVLCRTGAAGDLARGHGRFRQFPLEISSVECRLPWSDFRVFRNLGAVLSNHFDPAAMAHGARNRDLRVRPCFPDKYRYPRSEPRLWGEIFALV